MRVGAMNSSLTYYYKFVKRNTLYRCVCILVQGLKAVKLCTLRSDENCPVKLGGIRCADVVGLSRGQGQIIIERLPRDRIAQARSGLYFIRHVLLATRDDHFHAVVSIQRNLDESHGH